MCSFVFLQITHCCLIQNKNKKFWCTGHLHGINVCFEHWHVYRVKEKLFVQALCPSGWKPYLWCLQKEATTSISCPSWMGWESITPLPPACHLPVPIYTPVWREAGVCCAWTQYNVLPRLDLILLNRESTMFDHFWCMHIYYNSIKQIVN